MAWFVGKVHAMAPAQKLEDQRSLLDISKSQNPSPGKTSTMKETVA
jgi:hypothetical protein